MNTCMRLYLSRFKYGLFLVLTLGERGLLKLYSTRITLPAVPATIVIWKSNAPKRPTRQENFLGSQKSITRKGVCMSKRTRLFFIVLALSVISGTAHADYGWWDFFGVNPPNTAGKYPTAEMACQVAVSSIWYRGEKKYTHYVMNDRSDYATCHVQLKACSTCQWVTPNPPYWIDGQTIGAIRKGTPCGEGKSYNHKTGECFVDQKNNQGDIPATCSTPKDKKGNPIAISNGNKFQKEIYFQGTDPFPVKLELVYNSRDKIWRHSYSASLQETNTALTVVFADGRSASFKKETGQPLNSSETSRLIFKEDRWALQFINGEKLTFNTAGRLQRWENQRNEAVDLTYENAKFIRYTYNNKSYAYLTQNIKIRGKTQEMLIEERNQNRLNSAVINDKQFYFTWDESLSRLNSASIKLTPASPLARRQYHYESPYGALLLTGITDERGIRYATWTYDSQARAISSEHSDGADKITINYNSDGSSTVTNELGKKTTYRFAELDGIKRITAIEGEPSANCPNSNSTFTYDARGLLKTKTDNKGHLTTYDYNTRGLEISRTEAAGTPQARTVTTDWHPTLFLPITVTEPSRITHYTYDDQGRQLSQAVTQR